MGSYNPDAPVILGEQWVGIRNENLILSRASNTVEVGHRLVLPAQRTLQSAQFYVDKQPQGFVNGQVFQVALYPATNEDESGPLRRVYVPCTAGTRSGGATINAPAATVQEAVQDASRPGVSFSSSFGELKLYFDFTPYAQQLQGKRIMAVSLIYSMRANGVDAYSQGGLTLGLNDNVADLMFYGFITGEVGTTSLATHRVPFGEVNPFWNDVTTIASNECLPFTMQQLLRMVSTASHPFFVDIQGSSGSTVNAIVLQGVQLEVIYCEEQRVAYGSCRYDTNFPNFNNYLNLGTNVLPMRTPITMAANPVIPAGVYSVVVSSPSMGDYTSGDSVVDVTPELNQVRQYYTLEPHRGIQVNVPFPPWNNVGQAFTQEETVELLPQVSIHASGGAVFPEVHVYGRRHAVPVYGTITAVQGVDGEYAPASSFPQARYYARRFGNTVTPLTLSQGTFAATVTPAQFDALTEIVDGWKEVGVRLSSTPTGAQVGSAAWTWSAVGETVGNRWEVLAVGAPAVSGIPGNWLQNAPSVQRLSAATYLAPTGAAEALTWQSPQVSGTGADVDTDAVLLFSQDPPTVSGVAVSVQSQAVTGLNSLCVLPAGMPVSMPVSINYNQVSWTPPVGIVLDGFSRTVANGWGSADVGGAWATAGGVASDYSVGAGLGSQALTTTNVARVSTVGSSANDTTVQALVTCSVVATGAAVEARVLSRFVDASNYYFAELRFNTDGTVGLRIQRRSGGANTVLVTASFVGTYVAGSRFWVRFVVDGQYLAAWAWADGGSLPVDPTVVTSDPTLTAGTSGLSSIAETGNVNSPTPVVSFDTFTVNVPSVQYTEVQRSDAVDPTWYTVMRTTSQAVTGFKDYEARVGFQSAYRVRLVNMAGFVGTWSATGGATIAAPGVTGQRVDNSVLIFTTNAEQSGNGNMAYMQTWDGDASEDLTFVEAARSRLQFEYQRDYQTAFRPTERGGETFTRTLVVNNAAFATGPVLRGAVQGLRDLGWADVPYVCVRNELGDRWLANVVVPSASLKRNRAIQLAQVTVTEVTATPFAVDPAA